jgi:hypothetical protein
MKHHRSILRAVVTLTAAGCAPVDEAPAARADAVIHTTPHAPLPHQQGPRGGVKVWSYGGDPATRPTPTQPYDQAEWSGIEFGDVNGDGLDDLCGWLSGRYGCSLRGATERFEGFRRVPEFDGVVTADAFNVNLHWLVDLDRDGRADACVRDARGVVCAYATPTGFAVPRAASGAVQPFVADFSDANGWNRREYGSTVGVFRRDAPGGFYAPGFCGRGHAGVRCWFYNGSRALPATPSPIATTYADAQFWNVAPYYESIRYVDFNGDGVDEVCGRGTAGVYCTFYNRIWNTFEPAQLVGPDFSDDALRHGPSLTRDALAWLDLDGDGRDDLCVATANGLRCARSAWVWPGVNRLIAVADGTQFGAQDPAGQSWFDRWLHAADLDGDGRDDLAAMRHTLADGVSVYSARSSGGTAFGPTSVRARASGFGAMPLHVAHVRPGPARQVCGECAGLDTTYALADVCCTD